MARSVSIVEAKAHFSDYVRKAEAGQPVLILRHGKPVAAVVGAEDLAALDRLRAAGPQSGLAGLAGGWVGSDELVEILSQSRRSSVRSTPRLD